MKKREKRAAAQQELDAATTPETRNAAISKIMAAKNDEHFYWSKMGKVVRNSIEGAKLVMPKPETTTTIPWIATPGRRRHRDQEGDSNREADHG